MAIKPILLAATISSVPVAATASVLILIRRGHSVSLVQLKRLIVVF